MKIGVALFAVYSGLAVGTPCSARDILNDLEGQWVNQDNNLIIFNKGPVNDLLVSLPGIPGLATVSRSTEHSANIRISFSNIDCFYNVSPLVSGQGYAWAFMYGGNCPSIGHIQSTISAADIHIQRGVAHLKDGDYDTALAEFREALSINPKNATVLKYRGDAYFNSQNYVLAIESYTDAIVNDSNFAQAYDSRGHVHEIEKDYSGAIGDYSSAISIDDNPKYRAHRADVYLKTNDFDRAIADYTVAIDKKPKFDYAYNGRGKAYLDMKSFNLAFKDFVKALEINPRNLDFLENKRIAESEMNKTERIQSLWVQNGSVMRLVFKGDNVEFRYESPTADMRSIGIDKGTLKFSGQKKERQYEGRAYVYTKYCPGKGFGYRVTGSENDDGTLITLEGHPPRVDIDACQIGDYQGSSGKYLEFEAYNQEISGKSEHGKAYAKNR